LFERDESDWYTSKRCVLHRETAICQHAEVCPYAMAGARPRSSQTPAVSLYIYTAPGNGHRSDLDVTTTPHHTSESIKLIVAVSWFYVTPCCCLARAFCFHDVSFVCLILVLFRVRSYAECSDVSPWPWPWPRGLVLGLVLGVINGKAKMTKYTVNC